jgi:hypothetical protein
MAKMPTYTPNNNNNKNQDIALKLCVCMDSDNLHLQSLHGRALMEDVIELLTAPWANRRAFNLSSDFPIMAEAMSNHHQLLQ